MKLITKFQMGGAAPEAAPAEGGAPAPEMGGAPQGGAEDQLAQLAGQLLQMLLEQLQDPQAVMAVLQAAMEMLQQSVGGAQEAPVFRAGGKLVKKSKKACGGKMK